MTSRELAVAVARAVGHCTCRYSFLPGNHICDDCGKHRREDYPHDLGAAWEAAFRKWGQLHMITVSSGFGPDGATCKATISEGLSVAEMVSAMDKNPATALCHAIVKAKGGE